MTSVFRKTPAALASLLLVTALSACGGGDGPDSNYCKDLQAAQPSLDSLKAGTPSKLPDVFKASHKLAAEAPDAIKDDWKTFDDALSVIERALNDAGIGYDQLVQMERGQVPEGVDQSKLRGLPAKFQALDDPKVLKASNEIFKVHAKDVCKIAIQP